jgi:uncharacterized protein
MSPLLLGLIVGLAFGAALYLSDLANPEKTIGAFRLKDFHAMRVIGVFVFSSIAGVWLLDLAGLANYSIKPAAWLAVGLGGAFVGAGFGMTGYCPGTGLAAAAGGRIDAMIAVLGMFAGTAAYIATYRWIGGPIMDFANQGKVTLQEVTPIPQALWVLLFAGGGAAVLWFTRGAGGSKAAGVKPAGRPTGTTGGALSASTR